MTATGVCFGRKEYMCNNGTRLALLRSRVLPLAGEEARGGAARRPSPWRAGQSAVRRRGVRKVGEVGVWRCDVKQKARAIVCNEDASSGSKPGSGVFAFCYSILTLRRRRALLRCVMMLDEHLT